MKIHSDKISSQEWKNCEKFFKSTNTGSIKLDSKVVEGLEAYATVGDDVSLLNIFFHSDNIKKVIRIQFDETDITGNAAKQEVYVLDYLEKLGFSMKNLEQLESNVKSNDFMETLAFIENKKSILPKSVNKLTREEKAIQKVLLGFDMKSYYKANLLLLCFLMSVFIGCGKDPKRIENSELKYNIAKKFFFRGRVPEAIVNLEEALKENPKNSDAHNFYGLILFQSKRYEKAEKHFQKAVKVNEKFADAHNNLCALYIEVNRFSKAQEHCKKAVANLLYATPERAYYNLGRVYEKMAKDELAIENYEKSINSNARFVLALDKLGAVHFKQKNYKKSESYYKSASEACQATQENSWGEVCGYSFLKLSQIYTIFKDYKSRQQALDSCLKFTNKSGQAYKACQRELSGR